LSKASIRIPARVSGLVTDQFFCACLALANKLSTSSKVYVNEEGLMKMEFVIIVEKQNNYCQNTNLQM
jgi:hypothetical protein